MLTCGRVQNVAIIILTAIMILVSSPALALDGQGESEGAPEAVLNLDLCTLAYQLYHQSLCLPLDPWYDLMSRVGSDRRENICRFTHEYAARLGAAGPVGQSPEAGFYSGPNAARNWSGTNLNLDPILTNYKFIDARNPAFTRDGERYLAVKAPAYLSQNIRVIDGVRYRAKPAGFPSNDVEMFRVREYPTGEDHLVVFEGGTGIVGATEPAWSLMGFVLMHKTATGYDAHIVFRGSRSGASLAKTVLKAQDVVGDAKGNPDWITDLRGSKQIPQPLISKVGKVTEGFANSLPTMLGPVSQCCKYLSEKYPAPEHIFVTGHSLGAGLATQFASSVLQGGYGAELTRQVPGWAWDKIMLVAYAQPIPGDPEWAQEFDKLSPSSQHYWVEGDMVVEATSSSLVNLFIDKGEHAGIQKKLAAVANCQDNPHEVFVIRAALLRDLSSNFAPLVSRLGAENTWGYYENISKMVTGQAVSYVFPGAPAPVIVSQSNLRQVLSNCNFGQQFGNWLEQVYARMIADKSSYIGPKFQSTLDERRQLVLNLVARMRQPLPGDMNQAIDCLVEDFKLIDGNLGLTEEEQWIYSAMLLGRLETSPLTLTDLQSRPETKAGLESAPN
ncbi:MAG TPA: hypothetical protein PLI59_10785 [Candidatus Obscuribacter sp.]|nr:hypothetical protein [Candidatus Obscuribacter sp.]HNA72233.1 hypothetical protein [Candidatus Obscuribacter sp.]HND07116.1 hypothetical protein [Candidatus Obscuribacter sp.]HNG19653.1 hypothetical protein [Candidatus Obscuribacter sp.]HNG75820.1 hypothetical protein [Candidatus Obscuribacter sp.]